MFSISVERLVFFFSLGVFVLWWTFIHCILRQVDLFFCSQCMVVQKKTTLLLWTTLKSKQRQCATKQRTHSIVSLACWCFDFVKSALIEHEHRFFIAFSFLLFNFAINVKAKGWDSILFPNQYIDAYLTRSECCLSISIHSPIHIEEEKKGHKFFFCSPLVFLSDKFWPI